MSQGGNGKANGKAVRDIVRAQRLAKEVTIAEVA